jgi:hypothetical protein
MVFFTQFLMVKTGRGPVSPNVKALARYILTRLNISLMISKAFVQCMRFTTVGGLETTKNSSTGIRSAIAATVSLWHQTHSSELLFRIYVVAAETPATGLCDLTNPMGWVPSSTLLSIGQLPLAFRTSSTISMSVLVSTSHK